MAKKKVYRTIDTTGFIELQNVKMKTDKRGLRQVYDMGKLWLQRNADRTLTVYEPGITTTYEFPLVNYWCFLMDKFGRAWQAAEFSRIGLHEMLELRKGLVRAHIASYWVITGEMLDEQETIAAYKLPDYLADKVRQ
jgi:hypothetical protein